MAKGPEKNTKNKAKINLQPIELLSASTGVTTAKTDVGKYPVKDVITNEQMES